MKNNWNKILNELSYRVSTGIPDLSNEQHLMKLWDILKEHKWNIDSRVELLKNLNELEFKNKAELQKYASKHKIKPDTKVTVGDKETTAGEELPDNFNKDGEYIIEPEKAPKKNKDLDQDIQTEDEFNEGKLSEDGVSDEDFEKNEKIVSVDEPMSLEELESILPKPLPFPKKYVKVLHRLLNTKNKGKITISDFTDAAGGGTLESTAGEIVSMIGMSIDDEEQANKFFDTLEEHTKKNNKGKKNNRGIIDPSWVESARKVRQGIRDRYDRAFGKGNWKLKNSSWDIKEEVEALGVEDYRRDKGFSTDVYFTLEVDGVTILDEVSLKKDREANLLNSTSGRMLDIIIRGNATAEDYERYDSLYGKLKSEMSTDDKAFLKRMEEEHYTEEIPDNVKVSKVKKKQEKMHSDSLSSNNDAIRKDIDNFLSMSREEQLKSMMNIAKQLNQTPYDKWSEENLEDYKKLFEEMKNTEGTLSLDNIKSVLKKLAPKKSIGMRDIQKTSASLLVLNPESESSKDFDKIVENSHNHAKATADYLLSNETAREGLLKSIREDFPLQALMSGEESMHLADLSADKDTLKNIFGVDSFEELEQNLKVRETPPPASIVFSVKGKEEIPISTINTRPDGIGYGQSWKLEMKVHPEFAKELEKQNKKGK